MKIFLINCAFYCTLLDLIVGYSAQMFDCIPPAPDGNCGAKIETLAKLHWILHCSKYYMCDFFWGDFTMSLNCTVYNIILHWLHFNNTSQINLTEMHYWYHVCPDQSFFTMELQTIIGILLVFYLIFLFLIHECIIIITFHPIMNKDNLTSLKCHWVELIVVDFNEK